METTKGNRAGKLTPISRLLITSIQTQPLFNTNPNVVFTRKKLIIFQNQQLNIKHKIALGTTTLKTLKKN